MIERGHDLDKLQCRVKVKELRNAYHKVQEANCRSSDVPMSCRLYKELDMILAERLCRIRKRPRRTKEDFLCEVMMHSAAEKQELKEWQDSKKRDQKENVAHQKKATEQL
ncbi:hypothetical protein UY3_07526 [Chelonia mydas]|uniref:Uncharacterized protein n=1 Tax=Chelonia mydas TaxID=8469 RepID=M7BDX1_CHEMY|nr:hypothetical protein UY3_07526 [Chelonia mydas]